MASLQCRRTLIGRTTSQRSKMSSFTSNQWSHHLVNRLLRREIGHQYILNGTKSTRNGKQIACAYPLRAGLSLTGRSLGPHKGTQREDVSPLVDPKVLEERLERLLAHEGSPMARIGKPWQKNPRDMNSHQRERMMRVDEKEKA